MTSESDSRSPSQCSQALAHSLGRRAIKLGTASSLVECVERYFRGIGAVLTLWVDGFLTSESDGPAPEFGESLTVPTGGYAVPNAPSADHDLDQGPPPHAQTPRQARLFLVPSESPTISPPARMPRYAPAQSA